MTSVRLCGSEF